MWWNAQPIDPDFDILFGVEDDELLEYVKHGRIGPLITTWVGSDLDQRGGPHWWRHPELPRYRLPPPENDRRRERKRRRMRIKQPYELEEIARCLSLISCSRSAPTAPPQTSRSPPST